MGKTVSVPIYSENYTSVNQYLQVKKRNHETSYFTKANARNIFAFYYARQRLCTDNHCGILHTTIIN